MKLTDKQKCWESGRNRGGIYRNDRCFSSSIDSYTVHPHSPSTRQSIHSHFCTHWSNIGGQTKTRKRCAKFYCHGRQREIKFEGTEKAGERREKERMGCSEHTKRQLRNESKMRINEWANERTKGWKSITAQSGYRAVNREIEGIEESGRLENYGTMTRGVHYSAYWDYKTRLGRRSSWIEIVNTLPSVCVKANGLWVQIPNESISCLYANARGHAPCSLAAMNALTSLPSLCPPPLPLPLGRQTHSYSESCPFFIRWAKIKRSGWS